MTISPGCALLPQVNAPRRGDAVDAVDAVDGGGRARYRAGRAGTSDARCTAGSGSASAAGPDLVT